MDDVEVNKNIDGTTSTENGAQNQKEQGKISDQTGPDSIIGVDIIEPGKDFDVDDCNVNQEDMFKI